MNWYDAESIIRTRKRKMGNNTYIVNLDGPDYPKEDGHVGDIGLKFHNTIILKWHRDAGVTLNTSGWETTTTIQRLNAYQDLCFVGSDHGKLYVWLGPWTEGNVYHYYDGMRIFTKGSPLVDSGGRQLPTVNVKDERREHQRKLRASHRYHCGVSRQTARRFTVDDWEAHILAENAGIHYVHLCEDNKRHRNAATRCKNGKRCRHCKVEVPKAFMMAIDLQKLKRY